MNVFTDDNTAISIKGFSFAYAGAEGKALDGISADIGRGELALLCGTSGCGKTTLLRNLKPELAPAGEKSGAIEVFGRSGLSPRESAEIIGFVMQDPDNQIVMDSVWLELAFGLENLGVPPEEIGLRIGEIAAFFGIEGWFGKSVFELSGGQKQILSLAAVIAMQAEIVILDEPTSQLDPIAAGEFMHMLKRVNKELGTTVILSEHLLDEVLADVDKVIYLENGRTEYCGTGAGFPQFLAASAKGYAAALPAPTRAAMRHAGQTGEAGEPLPLDVKQGRVWLSNAVKSAEARADTPSAAATTVPQTATPSITNPASKAAITAKDIWFRYSKGEDFVLKGLDTEIMCGGLHIYVGGNGSGKSTLLGVLSGIYKPFKGKVIAPKDKKLCMLFQDPKSIFVCDTVADDLREHSADITDRDVGEIAERLRIGQLLRRHPYDLSAGEMQKAALAKVLLLRPDILLLDEPIKGLDAFAKREIGDILTGLKESGVTIAMVTHDIEFAAEYADACSMLFGRAIIANGGAREFFANNMFYTTSVSRMTRGILDGCVLERDVELPQ
ncbi:MAG: ATP-binding cassette domain-containing protein [Clostridiales Family XIII bacterium]|jgi:energy-coupling factor transport system ATP-binding protein|nr:ATP-binding cassette domain-containing protein [Clostridiales Family XIII bacterium]